MYQRRPLCCDCPRITSHHMEQLWFNRPITVNSVGFGAMAYAASDRKE